MNKPRSADETEWLAARSPMTMLEVLERLEASDQKLLLFGCACCRRIFHLVQDPRSRQGVEAVEAFLEGKSDPEATGRAYLAALQVGLERLDSVHCACMFPAANEYCRRLEQSGYYQFLMTTYPFDAGDHHMVCAWHASHWTAAASVPPESEEISAEELAAHVKLLQDIFGNPFHPAGRTRSPVTPQVLALAQACHEKRVAVDSSRPGYLLLDNDRLAVLADALEECGCAPESVVEHLRTPGEHVRGCWALDFVLGFPVKGRKAKKVPQWWPDRWDEGDIL